MDKSKILNLLKPAHATFTIKLSDLEQLIKDHIKDKHRIELNNIEVGFDYETLSLYVDLNPGEELEEEILDKIPYNTQEWYETSSNLLYEIFNLDCSKRDVVFCYGDEEDNSEEIAIIYFSHESYRKFMAK